MRSLVERLRAAERPTMCTQPLMKEHLYKTCQEAADEIERLRSLIDEHDLYRAETDAAFRNLDLEIEEYKRQIAALDSDPA